MESPSVELGECSEHPDHQLQYWRQDDQQWDCQYYLIFGAHKAHTALTQRAGQIAFVPRLRIKGQERSLVDQSDINVVGR